MLIRRRELLVLGASAAALAACNRGGAAASSATDMAIGAPDARVTLIEYASVTCPHCREFHETVYPQLKAAYIDTNRIKFIFREFPTPPAQVSVAGFQLARCNGATPEQYMARVGVLFDQQRNILREGATIDSIRADLVQIGQQAGLSEQQVLDCINDEHGAQRIRDVVDDGVRQFNIQGTPTFVLNGRKIEDPAIVTWDGMRAALDAALR